MSQLPVDSRSYIFAFAIGTAGEIPGDFVVPESLGPLRFGLFLPQDDQDWFGRSSYPPRVILLSDDEIAVIPHPSCRQQILRIPLREIRFVEAGHILLLGWIRLSWASTEAKFPYNTRTKQPVHQFLQRLTKACMPQVARKQEAVREWGSPLDRKFSYALSRELGEEETMLVRLFLPAERTIRKWLWLGFQSWSGANLIALTTRRVLWITDQCEGMYERYGTTSVAAPLASLRGVAREADKTACGLRLSFGGAAQWRTPVSAGHEAAVGEFAEEVEEIVNGLRRHPPS